MTKVRIIRTRPKPTETVFICSGEELEQMLLSDDGKPTDFLRWMTYDAWTVEEAVALSFNKSPEFMGAWLRKHGVAEKTSFHRDYKERLELVQRAVTAGDLNPLTPAKFSQWAKKKNLNIPEEMKKKYNKNQNKMSEDGGDATIQEVFHHRTRDTVYRFILGVAKLHYDLDLNGYERAVETMRSSANELHRRLQAAGYPISLTTLQAHLGEALDWEHKKGRLLRKAAGP